MATVGDEAFNAEPTANEVLFALQQQVGDLTLQLTAARLTINKALNRVRELEAMEGEEE